MTPSSSSPNLVRAHLVSLFALAGFATATAAGCSGNDPGARTGTGTASGALTQGVGPQALLYEIDVNPPSTDNPYEYVEIKCAPSATLSNVYFVSMEGDSGSTTDPPGTADLVISLDGVVCGANGLILVQSATGWPADAGVTIDPQTTVVTNAAFDKSGGGLENGSNSFLVIESPTTPITEGTNYDSGDAGTLVLPANATLLDGIGWVDGDAGDRVYGAQLTQSSGTPDAATRFPDDETQDSASAWYCGDLAGSNNTTAYSTTVRSANFPSDGVLTPGALNVGTTATSDAGADASTDAGSDGGAAADASDDGSTTSDAGSDGGTMTEGGSDSGTATDAGANGDGGTAPAGLVISQVYGGGGNSGATYERDFVELFNRGTAAVSTAGLAVMYGGGTKDFGSLDSDGAAPDTFALPAAMMAPGTYFLVGLNSNSATGAMLPTVDADGNIGLGATNGKVALVVGTDPLGCGGTTRCGTNARVVDMVGWGTGTDYEGSGPTGALSNTTAALRKGNGCVDTKDNAADFTTGTPAPRNSATTPANCLAGPPDGGAGDAGVSDSGVTDSGGPSSGNDAGGGSDSGGSVDSGGGPSSGDDGGGGFDSSADGSGGNYDISPGNSGCGCHTAGDPSNDGGLAFAAFATLFGAVLVRRRRLA